LTTKEQIFQEAFNLPWIMLPEDLAAVYLQPLPWREWDVGHK